VPTTGNNSARIAKQKPNVELDATDKVLGTNQAMTASGDAAVVLARLQSVVQGALKQVKDVQFDEQ
jgi:hypothetical protein